MSFGRRLKERREELGLKQSDLGKLLGVTGSAIGNYENGVSSPKADILYRVFDVLKCDANFLFQDEMKELETNTFSTSEVKIIKKYRSLDKNSQDFVSLVLDREYDHCQSLPDQTLEENAGYNVIYLPYPDNRASAGTGDEFLSDVTRSISVKENRLTIRADLVIKVDGNSMEPVYSDGDMVLVHQQPAVDIGAIGLYAANGKGYIKKQGKDCLISVNPDYPDIMPEKNYAYKCFGQVIGKLNPEWII